MSSIRLLSLTPTSDLSSGQSGTACGQALPVILFLSTSALAAGSEPARCRVWWSGRAPSFPGNRVICAPLPKMVFVINTNVRKAAVKQTPKSVNNLKAWIKCLIKYGNRHIAFFAWNFLSTHPKSEISWSWNFESRRNFKQIKRLNYKDLKLSGLASLDLDITS